MREHANPHENLRELLRRGDPAADGREPGVDEVAALRQAVLAEAQRPRGTAWLAAPAWALASAFLLAALLGWQIRGSAIVGPQERPTAMTASESPRAEEPQSRQIQFSTPGGTRVVWTLESDFEV